MYEKCFKRWMDFSVAFVGIIILIVPMLIIAVIIKIESKGDAVFKQVRLKKNQETFTVYKFRTMVDEAYKIGGIAFSSNDRRITKVGRFLRRTSLDELPQLFNILVGDMSLIGPRPILPIEFEEYKENDFFCKRYNARQGLFCTVDIKYRASCSREVQFSMDATYVEDITFLGDVRIFFHTIKTVVTGKNVYKEDK